MTDFKLKMQDKIVLIGDSITDCGRRQEFPPFGNGYVGIVVNLATAKYPDMDIEWVNKGIGGDTVRGLTERWTTDVIQEKTNWVSIAIGINDVGQNYGSNVDPDKALGDFEHHYIQIFNKTQEMATHIILAEVFFIAEEDGAQRKLRLDPYNAVIHDLADEYEAHLVPLDLAFKRAKSKRLNFVWTTGDGVHPNAFGHTLIALQILETLGW